MLKLYVILIIIYIFSLILNYLSFNSKKTSMQLVNEMGIGYNLGVTLNYNNITKENNLDNEEINLFGTTLPTKNILKGIKKYGFKTIRFQILYNNYTYNNDKINSEWIYKIKELINLINKLKMYLILSIKHTREFFDNEGRNSKVKYINFWRQIANELINYDEHLIFESIYEIGYLIYLNKINNYFEDKDYYLSQEFINIIRESGGLNIKRLLIIPMVSSDYELSLSNFDYAVYRIPKDPYNLIAISIYYYIPCEQIFPYNILEPFNLYDYIGYDNQIYPLIEWGSSRNYKDIVINFGFIKKLFTDEGIPVIIGEVGILNDYISKNNSIEQFLYVFFSMSSEYEGILPCLWDIPFASSTNENFYLNKENNEWLNEKHQNIFNKISKGKFIKSFDYYSQSNLETEDFSVDGYYIIYAGSKKIVKIFINVRFFKHIKNDIFMTVYSFTKDSLFIDFNLEEKDGKRQYDGTSIFTIDVSKEGLYYYAQARAWYEENYVIINNITLQYEESYMCFDHYSYKLDVLNEINY